MTSTPLPEAASSAQPPRRRSLGCIIGLGIFGSMVVGLIAVAATAVHALRLGPEARDLRDAAQEHFMSTGSWHPQVEVRLGTLTCALFREIVIEIADDPEATAVLRAARAVECGVYQVSKLATPAERVGFLRATTTTMRDRGWSRVVAVVDGDTTVAVFVSEQMPASGEVEFGVVVNDDQVVVVAVAQAKLAPLLELIKRHAAGHGRDALER